MSTTFRILSKSVPVLLLTAFVPAILLAQSGPLRRSIRASHSSPTRNSLPPVPVSPGAWSQLGQLIPNVSNNYFVVAYSVAIDGDTIVVGAFPTLTKDNGAAYVFTKPANGWSNLHSVASLNVPLSGGASSVAIQGDTIVVGVGNYNYGPGAAYVFEKPAGGWTDMNPTATLSSTDSMTGDNFGGSVAFDGSTVVVGSIGFDSDVGAAYIYEEPAGGWTNMTETAKLTASVPVVDLSETVSISGNTIVCGADGGAYVFVEPSAGWADMTQTAKLSIPGGGKTFFGSVSISGNTILAGTVVGSAYLFVEPVTGWTNMTQTATLTAGDGDPDFGSPVLLNGSTAVVGDSGRTVGPNIEEGGAYIFSEPKGGWKNMSSTTVLTASDARHFSWFGDALAMSGNTLVVGAPAFQFNGTAFVFGLP